LILELSNSASELAYEPLPQDDPKQRCPDITRAREVLGWEPRIAATQGLSRTLGWFAERNAERSAERHARSEAERDTGRAAG
jgi:nucleoside-diphosphate-sugar epimerase